MSRGLEVERHVSAELGLIGGEVQVGRLLVEGGSIPEKPWVQRIEVIIYY